MIMFRPYGRSSPVLLEQTDSAITPFFFSFLYRSARKYRDGSHINMQINGSLLFRTEWYISFVCVFFLFPPPFFLVCPVFLLFTVFLVLTRCSLFVFLLL